MGQLPFENRIRLLWQPLFSLPAAGYLLPFKEIQTRLTQSVNLMKPLQVNMGLDLKSFSLFRGWFHPLGEEHVLTRSTTKQHILFLFHFFIYLRVLSDLNLL